MALKRYIASHSGGFTTYIALPNREPLKVVFGGKDIVTKERFIDIKDPQIQHALETSPDFGVYYVISAYAFEQESTPMPIANEFLIFKNSLEAKSWLLKTHGVGFSRMPNKQKIIEHLDRLGLKHKFLSD